MAENKTDFASLTPKSSQYPKINSIFDFSAEALEQLAFLLASRVQIPRSQVLGLRFLVGTSTWDPASVADGAATSAALTLPGAAMGDSAIASFSNAITAGAFMVAHVTAADTVTVTLFNKTGSSLDLGSGTLKVVIVRV